MFDERALGQKWQKSGKRLENLSKGARPAENDTDILQRI